MGWPPTSLVLDRLHSDLIPENESGLVGPQLPKYVIVWDNVNFTVARSSGPGSLLIQGWSWHSWHLTLLSSILLLRSFEEHQAQKQTSLLYAMDAADDNFTGAQCRGWLRHEPWRCAEL